MDASIVEKSAAEDRQTAFWVREKVSFPSLLLFRVSVKSLKKGGGVTYVDLVDDKIYSI